MILFVPAFRTLMLATVANAAQSTGSANNGGIYKLASISSFTSQCHNVTHLAGSAVSCLKS